MKQIEFGGNKYRVLMEFKVYHEGWEMDNEAWIARDASGKPVCIMTSHGGYYLATVDELREHYERHLSASDAMWLALGLIGS